MKKYAGYKVKEIIDKNFDMRVAVSLVTYILCKGWEQLETITEEDISQVKGNFLIPDDFVQALARTAGKICKETDRISDFLPFIVNYLVIPGAPTKEFWIDKSDMSPDLFERIVNNFAVDHDVEEIESIKINANMLEYQCKG